MTPQPQPAFAAAAALAPSASSSAFVAWSPRSAPRSAPPARPRHATRATAASTTNTTSADGSLSISTVNGDGADVTESSIKTLEDAEEIMALAKEFDLADLRVVDSGVTVEISRPGGLGFAEGKLRDLPAPNVVAAGAPYAIGPQEHVLEALGDGEEFYEEEDADDVGGEDSVSDVPIEDPSDTSAVYDSDFVVTSNRVGFFYSGAKNKPPLVNVGDHVAFNQPVCIIEQLGQQYVYLSEASGTVIKIFVEDGDCVEYSQQVMVIRPD